MPSVAQVASQTNGSAQRTQVLGLSRPAAFSLLSHGGGPRVSRVLAMRWSNHKDKFSVQQMGVLDILPNAECSDFLNL
ncbi:hypothetical protein E4U41_005381 [Claviceps citrina]|nr:hypothetical protein E4U41_005381 [Claviceps citrina]